MRLSEPRIQPLSAAELSDEALKSLGRERDSDQPLLNIFATLAHHPKLLKRWSVFGNHVLSKSTLPPRDRELLILRTGWLCQAGYEWGQHVVIGKREGLSDAEIARIPDGADAEGWDRFDRTLLRAADELRGDSFLSDATWNALAERYGTQQLIDVVFRLGITNDYDWHPPFVQLELLAGHIEIRVRDEVDQAHMNYLLAGTASSDEDNDALA